MSREGEIHILTWNSVAGEPERLWVKFGWQAAVSCVPEKKDEAIAMLKAEFPEITDWQVFEDEPLSRDQPRVSVAPRGQIIRRKD